MCWVSGVGAQAGYVALTGLDVTHRYAAVALMAGIPLVSSSANLDAARFLGFLLLWGLAAVAGLMAHGIFRPQLAEPNAVLIVGAGVWVVVLRPRPASMTVASPAATARPPTWPRGPVVTPGPIPGSSTRGTVPLPGHSCRWYAFVPRRQGNGPCNRPPRAAEFKGSPDVRPHRTGAQRPRDRSPAGVPARRAGELGPRPAGGGGANGRASCAATPGTRS